VVKSSQRVRRIRVKSAGRGWEWLLAGLLLVLVGGALWWLLDSPWRSSASIDSAARGGSAAPGEELNIWFASPQEDALVSERRRVPSSATAVDRAKVSLLELLAGPKSDALRTVSAEVKIRELFIDDQGTVYVDFSEALSRTHPGGPWAEMLTIRSIMQTLMANVPEIKRVQILIEGHEVDTLAGHVDIRRPFGATWVLNQR
jgi:spore germination protein GerM